MRPLEKVAWLIAALAFIPVLVVGTAALGSAALIALVVILGYYVIREGWDMRKNKAMGERGRSKDVRDVLSGGGDDHRRKK